jgi:hypothetical protein
LEEAFRTGGLLDKPTVPKAGKGDSSLPTVKKEDIDVIVRFCRKIGFSNHSF